MRLTLRTLTDAGLAGPEVERYKADRRSRVWRVQRDGAPIVVKRFEYAPLRQQLALPLGQHPAQAEWRANRRLREANVRVVPLIDGGIERGGWRCHVWLASPHYGTSLQRRLKAGEDNASEMIDAAAALTVQLVEAGYTVRDLKPSNLIIDSAGAAWLIDVGSARTGAGAADVSRMLSVMDRVLERDGAEPSLRQRFAQKVHKLPAGG